MNRYDLRQSSHYSQRLQKYLPGGVHHNFYQESTEIPIVIKRAFQSRVWDIDGNEYLDLFAKYGALILGHNHKGFIEAMHKYLNKPNMVEMGEGTLRLCQYMCEKIPACEMVRFGLSATEMIQNAIRLARAYTGKQKIVRFLGHFHGSADNVLGGQTLKAEDPVAYDGGDTPFSTLGRADHILENQMYILPFNDLDAVTKLFIANGYQIAAILLEGIMINGGGIFPQKGYLADLKKLCEKHNILFILDETITGIRLGIKGVHGLYNVKPDLCVYGKSLSNGLMPVTALMGKEKIMKAIAVGKVVHAGTYNGFPFGLAAVQSVFDVLEPFQYYSKLSRLGRWIKNIFACKAKEVGLPLVLCGPVTCLTLQYAPANLKLSAEQSTYANAVLRNCLAAYGILIAPVSRVFPNLSLTERDLKFLADRVGYALGEAKIILGRLYKIN